MQFKHKSKEMAGTTKYLSVKQAAEMVGVKETTIRKWIRDGKLKAYKPTGTIRIFIKEFDIIEYVEGSKEETKEK